ncbi:MAG: 3-phosphoshikimate 1-carboxyvinyltransferase, partial [Lachnospiraceae bacterium]|nr:3-phosphoshikimate 1-carboxyvinyltransferase [Lachnospiraceae bacterium]
IERSRAEGRAFAPPSKSLAHRYLICAALADGTSRISNVAFSEDILATIDCIRALGAGVKTDGNVVTVSGIKGKRTGLTRFDCRESGSTIRFMMPIAMMLCEEADFYGSERLLSRPFSVYEDIALKDGIEFKKDSDRIRVAGSLKERDYTVPGNISSQFVTGLLFALSLSGDKASVTLTGDVESLSYIKLTLQALETFGVETELSSDNCVKILGGKLKATDISVEGDYSNAAFLDAFNLCGGKVSVSGLNPESLQGDKIYKKYFNMLLSVQKPVIDISDCPDLGPVLMALLAFRNGGTLTGTRRLRIKESDRAAAMAEELSKFGVSCEVLENSVNIESKGLEAPSDILYGHNDHRIVMSLSTLLSVTGGKIDGAEAVAKSYPDYFEVIKTLGIKFEEINNGMDQ